MTKYILFSTPSLQTPNLCDDNSCLYAEIIFNGNWLFYIPQILEMYHIFREILLFLLCLTCTLWSSLYEVEARFGRNAVESQDRKENHQPGRHPSQWGFQHELINTKDTKAYFSILFKETRESVTRVVIVNLKT